MAGVPAQLMKAGGASPTWWFLQYGGSGGSARIVLAANATYYVNASTGNDTTGTGSSGAPWATRNHAVYWVQQQLDLCGQFTVTINCTGSFNDALLLSGPVVGATGPGSLIINYTSGATVYTAGAHAHRAIYGGGFTVQGNGTSALLESSGSFNTISADFGGQIIVGNGLNFGVCGNAAIGATNGFVYVAASAIEVSLAGYSFLAASGGGMIFSTAAVSVTLAFIGGTHFDFFAQADNCGTLYVPSWTFSGSGGAGSPVLGDKQRRHLHGRRRRVVFPGERKLYHPVRRPI